jgi:hypothetical protein
MNIFPCSSSATTTTIHNILNLMLYPFVLIIHLFLINLRPLAVGLGRIVTLVHNQILRPVVVLAAEVAGQDILDTSRVALLGVDRGTGHVGDHGVASAPGVLGSAQRVVLGCGLREPHVTAVAVELAGGEGLGDILLDDDGTAGGVDEPGT